MTVEYILQSLLKTGSDVSREISEWAGPAYDLYREGDNIVLQVDVPGYELEDITPTIYQSEYGSGVHIKAKRDTTDDKKHQVIEAHRPKEIDSVILFPVFAKEDVDVIDKDKTSCVNGVLTLTLTQSTGGKPIDISVKK